MTAALPAIAQAAVTESSITTPADPYYAIWNDSISTPSLTISGTSNGTTGDAVDVLCYHDNGSSGTSAATLASNVTVAANGSFTTAVPLNLLYEAGGGGQGTGECRLRAVPHSTTPGSGLSAYSGPRALVGYYHYNSTGHDYQVLSNQLGAQNEYNSLGGCGIEQAYLNDPTTFGDTNVGAWGCNDWTENKSVSDPSLAGIEIDGQAAYSPATAAQIDNSATGLPTLTVNSVSENSTTGDLTIDETDPLVFCSGHAAPVNDGSCSTFVSAGVSVHRIITQIANGHTMTLADTYSSTDGAAHAVSLRLENDQTLDPSVANTAYEFPGQTSFSAATSGEQVTASGALPATIYIKNTNYSEPSTQAIRGAITYYQTPSGPFTFQSPNPFNFDALNSFTVPATGGVPIEYWYSDDYTLAGVEQEVADAEDANDPPAATITSPVAAATLNTGSVTVTGTASAGSGVGSVTVNGVTATLNGTTWTATIPLAAGENTITVIVTSDTGATATTSETVDYVTSSTSTTTTTTTTPTPTPTPTPTSPSPNAGVGLSATAMALGITVSDDGGLVLPLVCPQTPDGCDADGLLTLTLASPGSHTLRGQAVVPVKDSVLATFSGIEIETGQSRLVSVELTPAATRYLQSRGIRRVQVTLTIHNHLSGGADVTTSQQVWLNIAALGAACPAAVGTLTPAGVAQMRLGLTRRRAHRLGPHRKARFGFERYCLTGGKLRVAYTTKALVTLEAGLTSLRPGHVALLLTGNRHYVTHGIRAGMTVAAAQARLDLGQGFVIGRNTWYFVPGLRATTVIKARAGVVREIGIANLTLSRTPDQQVMLLRHP